MLNTVHPNSFSFIFIVKYLYNSSVTGATNAAPINLDTPLIKLAETFNGNISNTENISLSILNIKKRLIYITKNSANNTTDLSISLL